VVAWVLAVLAEAQMLVGWFDKEVAFHLFGKYRSEYASDRQSLFDAWAIFPPWGKDWVADLLTCPVCLGTWLSLPFAAIVSLAAWHWLPLATFPSIAYAANVLFRNKYAPSQAPQTIWNDLCRAARALCPKSKKPSQSTEKE